MPEYDHQCRKCGHQFTVFKKITQSNLEERCPVCGGETTRKWGTVSILGHSSGSCGTSSGFPGSSFG